MSTDRSLLERLLGAHGIDPGCEATFRVLDAYVEAVLRGEEVTARYAAVVRHLRSCAACGEDTEGLLTAIRDLDASA